MRISTEAGPTGTDSGSAAGWQARLELAFEARPSRVLDVAGSASQTGRTVLSANRHQGPLRVQKALHPEGPGICHAVILHPPAGIVGGDRLTLGARLGSGSHAVLSTPGATPWYRSEAGFARQAIRLELASAARLDWLPQPSILYDGALAETRLELDLGQAASVIGWEMTVLGRRGHRQAWSAGRWRLRTALSAAGRPLWFEQGEVQAASALTDGVLGFAGLPVVGSLWAAGPAAHGGLAEALAARLPFGPDLRAGVSCLGVVGEEAPSTPVIEGGFGARRGPGLLLVRALAREVEAMQDLFRSIWSTWRPVIHGTAAQPLRLWAT